MTAVEKIEQAVAELDAEGLAAFRAWFEEYDAASWDKQFEVDAQSGALDAVVEVALRDYGDCKCQKQAIGHFASPSLLARDQHLPRHVRDVADRSFALLMQDMRCPELHVKKVGAYCVARMGLGYRTLAVEVERGLLWFWIGTHDEYDRLVR